MLLITKSESRKGAYVKEKPFPKNFWTRYRPFADCALLGLTQSAILTWFEGTSDLDAKEFSSGTSDGLGRMYKFNVKVVDIFLGWGCSWLCSFIICFAKKINFSDLMIASLNLTIKDDVAAWGIHHYVVMVVIWYLVSLHEFTHQGNRFAPALGQNFMGHSLCTHSVPLTSWTLMHSLPCFIACVILELPWINSSMLVMSYRLVSSLDIWQDAPESPI